MKHLILPVFISGIIFLAVGATLGYFAGKNAVTSELFINKEKSSRGGRTGGEFSRDKNPSGSFKHRERKSPFGPKRSGEKREDPEERAQYEKKLNSYRKKPVDELLAIINKTGGREAGEFAVKALVPKILQDPENSTQYLGSISKREGVMHHLCRELVIKGGRKGARAVLSFITDSAGDMEMRERAIHSLGHLPPESRAFGKETLFDLMTTHLPERLQHNVCEAYIRTSKETAANDFISMIDNEACMIERRILLEKLGRAGTADDVGTILDLAKNGTWTRELERTLLRSAARAGKNGNVLLDYLESADSTISAHNLAGALADTASSVAVDQDRLISLLSDGDLNPGLRRELSRAVVKNAGDEGLNHLLDLAAAEDSAIDADILGSAFAESGQKRDLPLMADLLSNIKNPRTMHELTRKIVETGGREGVETLLQQIENGGMEGHMLHPLCETVAEAGTIDDARRLFEILEHTGNPENARALVKTACHLSGNEGIRHAMELLQTAGNGHVRAVAADVIGHEGGADSIPYLVEAFRKESHGKAQWEIAHALAAAGTDGTDELFRLMEGEKDQRKRHAILSSMERIDEETAVPFLAQALSGDASPEIRGQAAGMLAKKGHHGSERAIEVLTEAQRTEPNPDVQKWITRMVKKIQEKPRR